MNNVRIRCRSCGKELEGHHNRTISCGCTNMTTIRGDKISGNDLSNVIMLSYPHTNTSKSDGLTSQDLQWQEERRKRKVRKLDFEIR